VISLFALMQSSESSSVKHVAKQNHFLKYTELNARNVYRIVCL